MKLMTPITVAKALLLILAGTIAVSSLASPCLAQPAISFIQIMIPSSLDKCVPHMTAAFGEVGYAVEQSGDRWATAVKGNTRAAMVCGLGDGKNSTQLTIFVAGPNPDDDKNRLQVEMQRRFRR